MNSDTNKAVVERYLEMWNTKNLTLAEKIFSPTFIDHAYPENKGYEWIQNGETPEHHIVIEHMASEGDIVAMRGSVLRRRDGQETTMFVMWFMRFIDGKIEEMWTGSQVTR